MQQLRRLPLLIAVAFYLQPAANIDTLSLPLFHRMKIVGGSMIKWALPLAALVLSGCAMRQERFYADRSSGTVTELCRAALETDNRQYFDDLLNEIQRRGEEPRECQKKVNNQNTGLAFAALAFGVTGAAIYCSNHSCGGGGYASANSSSLDRDCAGGSGDGPLYVQGPVRVGFYDPYDLDRDGDGIGCETSDVGGGA